MKTLMMIRRMKEVLTWVWIAVIGTAICLNVCAQTPQDWKGLEKQLNFYMVVPGRIQAIFPGVPRILALFPIHAPFFWKTDRLRYKFSVSPVLRNTSDQFLFLPALPVPRASGR